MQRRQRLELIHKHPAYPSVEKLFRGLHGFQSALAGGSVRDALLGRAPKDLDVATSAPPDEVERAFPSTLAVGKAFGTIVVILDGHNFEVTTFRSEGPYLDGRHPSTVAFSAMEEDSKRRDFTINALFYDPINLTLYDFNRGLEDLGDRSLRTVGVAQERFNEDHLRMLRAARFVAQLGFSVEPSALVAMRALYERLHSVSAERILNEMSRLLAGPYLSSGLQTLIQSQLYLACWPELEKLDVSRLSPFGPFLSWENAFAAVAWLTKVDPEARLRAWKASNESVKKIKAQMQNARVLLTAQSARAERVQALGGPEFAETLTLVEGLLAGEHDNDKLESWIEDYLQVAGSDGQLPKPLLNGDDLLEAGMQAGEKMGRILKSVYKSQLEGTIVSKEQALKMARALGGGSVI